MTSLSTLRESSRAVITVAEAAKLLEVDERTVRRACGDGQIPSLRVGVRLLIPREKFLDLFATTSEASPTETADTLRLLPESSAS